MTFISDRPRTWNQVVGQQRAVRMLHALLRSPQYMTQGFILEGPYAVGKTTCAYLFARALMCQGSDPLGCGQCASCLTADESIETHPSFREVDGAKFGSVKEARELLDQLGGPATLGKRSVVLVDEAHRLSPEAFDVFLKPLERRDTEVVFLFVTSEGSKIPGTINSRCAVLRFEKVDLESLTGMLMVKADKEGIRYRQSGLQAIAKYSQGRPRDAMKNLGLAAAFGEVLPDTVEMAINCDAQTIAREILKLLAERGVTEAIKRADSLASRIGPVAVVETLFSCFAEDVFVTGGVTSSFAPLKEMSGFFIKWSSAAYLPGDITPLFIVELNEMRSELYRQPEQGRERPTIRPQAPEEVRVKAEDRPLSPSEALAILES